MCNIFIQQPGYTLPYEKLETCVFNNWHSYGIILKANGKLEVRKGCSDSDDKICDPQEIYKILKDNEDVERFVHLRHRTEGEINEANTQPFPVLSTKKRSLYFMHNGTMQAWRGQQTDPEALQGASDSRRYAELQLTPMLTRLVGTRGIADLEDPYVRDILEKFWPGSNNRGLLISSDQEPYFFSPAAWSTKTFDQGQPFKSSNDDYWNTVQRGPEKERLDAERKKREEEARAKNNSVVRVPTARASTKELSPLISMPFKNKFQLSEAMLHLLEDWDIYNDNGWQELANVTHIEWEDFIRRSEPQDLPCLLFYATDAMKRIGEKNEKMMAKLAKASKLIADFKNGNITVDKLPDNFAEVE